MRMCGHAHHDDMLYLGKRSAAVVGLSAARRTRLRRSRALRATGPRAIRSPRMPRGCEARRRHRARASWTDASARSRRWSSARRAAVIDAPWPDAGAGRRRRLRRRAAARARRSARSGVRGKSHRPRIRRCRASSRRRRSTKGSTFLEGVMLGVSATRCAPIRASSSTARTSAASTATRSCCCGRCSKEFGDRIINSPLAEGAVLGVCVGAALAGQRPIGEMQFNDFVATGFNQLVNNAAKIRYRWGGSVPMVVRMPWGGLRHAGPYHSQNTEPWFYRTPGLKIVVPSTPHDARALMASAVADPDPVLYLRAHRALSRSAHQAGARRRHRRRRCRSARRRCAAPATTSRSISYGAYVHAALRVAERLAADGIDASVLDLRSLVPLDRRRRARGRPPLQPRADRPRGLADRRHRREPRRDHPGGSVRVARRARPRHRRARHAGAVLAAARGAVSPVGGGDRAGGAAPGGGT